MGTLSERLTPTPRKAADAAARGSGMRALLFLGLAVIAALGAGLLFSRYVERRSQAITAPTQPVVIAAAEIPPATTLRAELLTTLAWPKGQAPQGAAGRVEELVGRVAVTKIHKGVVLLPDMLAASSAGQGLAAILPAAMRAVSVRVDDVVGVAGFIHPGDHVDVIVTMKPDESSEASPVSKVILQNVQVLAVGKELDRKGKQLDKAVPVTVATLMVSSEESERLALAATKGQILLALRSRIDSEQVATPGVIPPVLLGQVGRARVEAPVPASGPAGKVARNAVRREAPALAPKQEIEILRGDLFEKRRFAGEGK